MPLWMPERPAIILPRPEHKAVDWRKPINRAMLMGPSPMLLGGGALSVANVFAVSTWVGNSSAQTITSGINLSAGGAVLVGDRGGLETQNTFGAFVLGTGKDLALSTAGAQATDATSFTAFNSNGFAVGSQVNLNDNPETFFAWQFASNSRFFSASTYTGNGSTQTIAHGLAGTPGLVVVKKISASGTNWIAWHKDFAANNYSTFNGFGGHFALSTTNTSNFFGNNSAQVVPDASNVTVGSNTAVNASGATYLVLCFYHDPAGVIQCGSYTGNGSAVSGPTVTLGWQPQALWTFATASNTGGALDTTRGWNGASGDKPFDFANIGEGSATTISSPGSTGYQLKTTGAGYNSSSTTYYYMAIHA